MVSGSVSELLGGVMRLWSVMMGRASVNDGQLWRALASSVACLGGEGTLAGKSGVMVAAWLGSALQLV